MGFFLLEKLPLELQSLTLSMCSYLSLYQLSRVSKGFKEKMEKDEWLWRLKTMRDFGGTLKISCRGGGWWKIYRHHREDAGKHLLSAVRQSNSEQALKILQIDEYTNISTKCKNLSFFTASARGLTTLLSAFSRCGVDLDIALEQNYTALIMASRYDHLSTVEFLLEKGVNINAQNKFGYTALMWASLSDNRDIVRVLLRFGAKVDLADNMMYTPLLKASRDNNLAVVKILLDANADPNHQNERGATALMEASFRGHSGIVSVLLESNADPNIRDKSGCKALNPVYTPEILDILKGE